MFRCRLCMRRCIRSLNAASKLQPFGCKIPSAGRFGLESLRTYVTSHPHLRAVAIEQPALESQKSKARHWSKQDTGLDPVAEELGVTKRRSQWITSLTDPVQLADHVKGILPKGRFDEALEEVRNLSKTIKCTVSWNHLIDWQLANGKLNGAVKLYNEMKKRGQVPDAHTFTILFRGMAANAHYATALPKALSIYHGMDAANSPVRPNTIHTNAVLMVCARAGDMDAMFGIAAKLRNSGLRAPNNLTYTIILNAIRENAVRNVRDLSGEDLLPLRTKSVQDARRIWEDVVSRWRKGDIWIDEELICSMGRVLLLGTKEDADDVFSLLEQAMDIPRIVPKYGSPARMSMEPAQQGQQNSTGIQAPEMAENVTKLDPTPTEESRDLVLPMNQPGGVTPFASPGRNSLSLLLETLQSLGLKKFAAGYWETFTSLRKVVPDSDNYHKYLRLLRVARASTETVELLQKVPKDMLQLKTFRIAMSTCVRDKNNPNAFANAGKILDLMQQSLASPDILALMSYLEVATTSSVSAAGTPSTVAGYALDQRVLRALERLIPSLINLKADLAYGPRDRSRAGPDDPLLTQTHLKNYVHLIRLMIGCYDKLIVKDRFNNKLLLANLKQERSKLAAIVTRYNTVGLAKETRSLVQDGKYHRRTPFDGDVNTRFHKPRQVQVDPYDVASTEKHAVNEKSSWSVGGKKLLSGNEI